MISDIKVGVMAFWILLRHISKCKGYFDVKPVVSVTSNDVC